MNGNALQESAAMVDVWLAVLAERCATLKRKFARLFDNLRRYVTPGGIVGWVNADIDGTWSVHSKSLSSSSSVKAAPDNFDSGPISIHAHDLYLVSGKHIDDILHRFHSGKPSSPAHGDSQAVCGDGADVVERGNDVLHARDLVDIPLAVNPLKPESSIGCYPSCALTASPGQECCKDASQSTADGDAVRQSDCVHATDNTGPLSPRESLIEARARLSAIGISMEVGEYVPAQAGHGVALIITGGNGATAVMVEPQEAHDMALVLDGAALDAIHADRVGRR